MNRICPYCKSSSPTPQLMEDLRVVRARLFDAKSAILSDSLAYRYLDEALEALRRWVK